MSTTEVQTPYNVSMHTYFGFLNFPPPPAFAFLFAPVFSCNWKEKALFYFGSII